LNQITDMQPIAFLQNLSSWEIILIFLVVLLFFGAKRLPDLFRSFGKSLREFKQATSEIEDDFRTAMDEDEKEKSKRAQRPAKTEATTDPKPVEPGSDDEEGDSRPDNAESDANESDEKKKDDDTKKA
jgi:sec-independent protein translocase protein TatA